MIINLTLKENKGEWPNLFSQSGWKTGQTALLQEIRKTQLEEACEGWDYTDCRASAGEAFGVTLRVTKPWG
ncbi:MAG: hypothetical protein LBQ81_02085 [Zoogloeaceae bacterium]|jgi:hypothetical protein|nr:hypothetical protein [Zoogloeaceae bacterium]